MNDVNLSKIENMIYVIRGQKVMLDSDLAKLYGVETKALNRQVVRNKARFPEDFMFNLTTQEYELLRCQNGTSNVGRGGRRYLPLVFTEGGVAMLSSVLTSDRAAQVNLATAHDKIDELGQGTYKLFKVVFERLDTVDIEIQELKKEKQCLPIKRKKIGLKSFINLFLIQTHFDFYK